MLQLTRTVHAGPNEVFADVAFDPHDKDAMAVRYINGGEGAFYTRDGGKSWQLLCGSGVDPMLLHVLPMNIAGDGRSMLGAEFAGTAGADKNFKTLMQDDGHGCAWQKIPQFDGRTVVTLAADPADPDAMFALVSDNDADNGILRRDAKGAWRDVGARSAESVSSFIAAKTNTGLRFYETRWAVAPDAPPADEDFLPWPISLRVSDDQAKTWRDERAFGSLGQFLELLAVDPSNPDRVVALLRRGEGMGNDVILVSSDQGASFSLYLGVTEFGGFAFAPDGRVWIGDAGNANFESLPRGLWSAKNLDQAAEKLADFPVGCLGYQTAGDQLFACNLDPAAEVFGRVNPSSGDFTPLLRFTEAKEFVSCAGVDAAATCQTQLCGAYCGIGHYAQAPVCEAYSGPGCGPCIVDNTSPSCVDTGGTASLDAGKDAGSDAGAAPKKKPSSGCSCSTFGKSKNAGGTGALLLLTGLALGLDVRRRNRA
jgi:hypothetical protein